MVQLLLKCSEFILEHLKSINWLLGKGGSKPPISLMAKTKLTKSNGNFI
jgi:hypothetical protein